MAGNNKTVGRYFAVRRALLVSTAVVTLLFTAEAANAACDPAAADNVIAVCTGNTVDQGPRPSFGYGEHGIHLNVTVNAGGSVAGSSVGIGFGYGSVTSYGAITGGDVGITGFSVNVTNFGSIAGPTWGIAGVTAVVVANSGSIASDETAITSNGSATITNSGRIAGSVGAGIYALGAVTVTNSGTIIGGFGGVLGTETAVINSGSIIATDDVALYGANISVKNSGTITGATTGIVATTAAVVTNSGNITGGWFGVISSGSADVANSGTIIGGNGTALKFNADGASLPDRLTVLPGARFGGRINFGGGADKVAFGAGSWILHTANFDAVQSTVATGGNPYVVTPDRIVVADLSVFGAMNRTVMDVTGWISSLLPDTPAFEVEPKGAANAFAAIEQAAPRFNGASTLNDAMAYAPTPAFKSSAISDRDGNTVFAKSFGGRREQQTEGGFIGSIAAGYGGAFGYERRITENIRLGGFVGASTNETRLDLNAGHIDTNALFGGLYARHVFDATFLDLALIGGKLANDSWRNIGGGLAFETARASYGGWFIDPALAFGHRFALDNGNSITPALKLRYIAARFEGYSESGSSANLSVAGRTVQAFEERADMTFARVGRIGDSRLTVRLSGGAVAQQLVGDSAVNVILLGQNFVAAMPGKIRLLGLYAGAGLDWQFGRVALFASGETVAMNDDTRSFAGKGGIHIAW